MTTTTAPNAHEAEIDTEIADASEAYARAASSARWYEKHGRDYHAKEAAVAADKADATLRELLAAERKYEGWSRFFLVKASNGHIHSSMNCHSTFPSTMWAWLPELSGLTEADAVEAYGGILCTHCFPSAPTDWTTGVNKKDAERKAAEAALKTVAKTPEGKAVVNKLALVSRHRYTVDNLTRDLEAPAREVEAAATYGKTITLADVGEGTLARAARAGDALPAAARKLAKAEAALAEASAALDAALGS